MNASRGQGPRVGQLMTEPALTVEASTRLQDLAASMVGRGIDSALVVEHGRLRALLTERDLVRRGLARGLGPDAQVAQVVVAAPAAVGPQASPGAALDLMLRSEQVYLPVVDEGRLLGAVSWWRSPAR